VTGANFRQRDADGHGGPHDAGHGMAVSQAVSAFQLLTGRDPMRNA
jgi:hypothetical protein